MTTPSARPHSTRLLGGLTLDIRTSIRGLRRRPAFTFTAILTIALGVGATTAMFSAIDAILLRDLPYATPDRLVALMPERFVAQRDVDALRTRMTRLDQVTVFSPGWLMPLIEIDEPRQVNAARVGGNLFSMVGARPLLGQTFTMDAERPGNGLVAVLGWDLWQDVFRGDSGIVGRSIALDGARYTVTGVMPRGFQLFDWQSDLWIPMTMSRQAFMWTGATGLLYGRLAAGVTHDAAVAELRNVLPSIASEFSYEPSWSQNAAIVSLHEHLVGDVSRMLWLLFGAVAFLLLIATGNVANLLLVRASERRGELALRRSLGAPSSRVARLLFTESLILGAAGGVLGLGLAVASIGVLPGLLPRDLPRLGEIALNTRLLAFALVVTLVPSLGFALAPVVQSVRGGLSDMLREARGARRGERLRGGLVALQVALSLVLLVGASIMWRSLTATLRVDRGLRSDHLLTAAVMPSGMREPEQVRAFWREALRSIEAIPGVIGAATILHLPTSGRKWMADIEVAGRPSAPGAPKPRSAWQSVSHSYFSTAGVPVIAGRPFTPADNAGSPRVVAVNTAFAEQLFPGESPLGRVIVAGNSTNRQEATIVAVVGGVRHDSLSAAPTPEIYVPIEQQLVYATGLIVRTTGDPLALAPVIRQRIWDINPNVPISDVRSMDERFSASLQRPRLILGVLSVFALGGLVLGAVGIYGVVAYAVQQRARELGIRAALGAHATALQRLVLRGGLRYAAIGIVIGVPVALALSRVLRGIAYGVSAADPVSFTAVGVLLVLVTGAASWIPARRGARSDPMVVLREE
ncbi:MAG TPA: ABC transporter permease [Gemmatimonadaceae bacterium]